MNKIYEEPQVTVFIVQDDIVRTSTGKDPFNDDYIDPNIFKG